MADLSGKVALVTGGSQGIGRALVTALLNSGMKVCICDVNEEAANEFIKNLPTAHQENVIFQLCDVASFDNFKAAFDRVISFFGRIDLVVNNAGILNEINWRKVIDVNVVGVINGTKLGFEYMNQQKTSCGGDIINIASVGGLSARPLYPVYSATKHAVVGLTRSYGSDYHLARSGVRVNAVCPSATETNLRKNIDRHSIDEEESRRFQATKTPLEPEDVAKALMQLLQDGKNGALLKVDPTGTAYV